MGMPRAVFEIPFKGKPLGPGPSTPRVREETPPPARPHTRWTKDGVEYEVPTIEQIRASDLVLEGRLLKPEWRTSWPVTRCLPPPGQYFDEHNLPKWLAKLLDPKGKCLSCYRPKHATQGPNCRKMCKVCRTNDHHGEQCTAAYLSAEWWKAHGHPLDSNPPVQVRPSPDEWAYLVLAKVLRPVTSAEEPIVANEEHPAVKEFYKDKPIPKMVLAPADDPGARKKPAKIAEKPQENVKQEGSSLLNALSAPVPDLSSAATSHAPFPRSFVAPVAPMFAAPLSTSSSSATFPSFPPSVLNGSSDGGETYRLPTYEQLKKAKVVFEDANGQQVEVSPVTNLKRPIESYLPPPGGYYDQYTILMSFDAKTLSNKGTCLSCWYTEHVVSHRDCISSCLICLTMDHLGQECPLIFATLRWWKDRGHTPPATFRLRPQASVLAYLIVEKVVMPMYSLQGAIVPNRNHPIVKKLYGTKASPYAIQPSAENNEGFQSRAEIAAEPSVTTAGSLVHGDGGRADVDSQLHRVCDRRIEDLQGQLNKAREVIAARDGRIAELEGTLNEGNEVLGRQPGRKRARMVIVRMMYEQLERQRKEKKAALR